MLIQLGTTSMVASRRTPSISDSSPTQSLPKIHYIIVNPRAFSDLLCDFTIWERVEDATSALLSHLLALISPHSPYRKKNLHSLTNRVKIVPSLCKYAPYP
jgi:hypothetical protein